MSEIDQNDLQAWNEIWNSAHEMKYECFFQELCSEWLVNRWKAIDSITKFLITFTASGSAISGWVLWNYSVLSELWAVLAGCAAVLSIIHSSFNITTRIEEATLQYSQFKSLRMNLDSFQIKMKIKAFEKLEDYKSEIMSITQEYGKIHTNVKPDFILIDFFKKRIIIKLNKLIGYE